MKRVLFLVFPLFLVAIGGLFLLSSVRDGARGPAGAIGAAGEAVGEVSGEAADGVSGEAVAIGGRVLTASGAPIAGARVWTGEHEATTDEEGAFAFAGLSPGVYALDATADGYVRPGPAGVGRLEVTVVEGGGDGSGGVRNLEIVLHRPGRLQGRVHAAGRPVEGASLSLFYEAATGLDGRPLEPFVLSNLATSDGAGRFSLEGLAAGRMRVMVEADGYAMAESADLWLRGGEERGDVVVDLVASGTLSGTIVDGDGRPIRAEVVLAPEDSAAARDRRAVADPAGRYTFSGVAVGTHRLVVRAPGYRTEVVEGVVVEAGDRVEHDVLLTRGGGLFGRVLTAAGAPAAGAYVVFSAAASNGPGHPNKVVRAGEDGTFGWDDPPAGAGAWSAVAVTPFDAPTRPERAHDGQELVLQLGEGGLVEGRVVGPRGAPIDSFTLAVELFEVETPYPYGNRAIGSRQVARADGAFSFGPLRPGTYQLRAQAPGLPPAISERIRVHGGRTTGGVTIRVGEGATVTGRVTAADTGAPVANAAVTLFEPLSPLAGNTTRTDADGRYTLRGVPDGRRSLRVTHRDYTTELASGLEVRPGGEHRRDVALAPRTAGERMSFHGIGAVLRRGEGGVEIQSLLDDMPGATYGLERGDRILSVDRQSTREMALDRVVELIRGEEGAPVTLEVERDGQGVFTVEIERGRVVVR